uniref:Uncharacterized protein n=1 Tax=Oryza sativa subsp. japonica TaxID=39947 RepID=Q651X5_ORYSJ|nr:hypothetical protein [Oryza sativa Japonica Group]
MWDQGPSHQLQGDGRGNCHGHRLIVPCHVESNGSRVIVVLLRLQAVDRELSSLDIGPAPPDRGLVSPGASSALHERGMPIVERLGILGAA